MDFRGRLYPIPVLLQPQGSDLAKGLLHFSVGKPVDANSIKWLQIHGANMYGFDKENYDRRIKWIEDRTDEIKQYAENPILNRGWAEADKPFQFLAFCLILLILQVFFLHIYILFFSSKHCICYIIAVVTYFFDIMYYICVDNSEFR